MIKIPSTIGLAIIGAFAVVAGSASVSASQEYAAGLSLFDTVSLQQSVKHNKVLGVQTSGDTVSASQVTTAPALPTTPAGFITHLYSCILGRQPDDPTFSNPNSGPSYWLNNYNTVNGAGTNLPDVVGLYRDFYGTGEFDNRQLSNTDFINNLYLCAYFRGSDTGGRNFWVNQLDTGTNTRAAIENEFLNPNVGEFADKIVKLQALRVALAPTPKVNASPVGYFDVIQNDVAYGWSYDPDDPGKSVDMHLYIDGTDSSHFVNAITANSARPDVNQATGASGNHGFAWTIPDKFKDGKQHTLYVFGIDLTDTTGASNVLLGHSPQNFTLGNAVATTIDTLDYFVSKHARTNVSPGSGLTDAYQTIIGNRSYFVKWNKDVYEVYNWDDNYIYHQEDHNSDPNDLGSQTYKFIPGLWMKRQMKIGEQIDQKNTHAQYFIGTTCQPTRPLDTDAFYVNTLEAHIPNYDAGGDLGIQDVIVLDYKYTPSLRYEEKYYYSKEWGWVNWEYYIDGVLQTSFKPFNKIQSSFISPNIAASCTEKPAAAVSAPTISPNGAVFSASQTVSLSDTTPGATIRYTLDGSEPNVFSTLYTAPFNLSVTTIVKAKAFAGGMLDSAATLATFVINPVTPPTALPITAMGFIQSLYSCVLNRTPDSSGLTYWVDNFNNGGNIQEIYSEFYKSSEFSGRNVSNADYALGLYRCMLFRNPDSGGYGYWVGVLDNGADRTAMRKDFLDIDQGSGEFRDYIMPQLEALRGK